MVLLNLSQKIEITDYINHYRSIHQSPSLVWDDTIALFAEHWSSYLNTNDLFQHSGTTLYSENLAWFDGYGTDIMTLLKKAVDNWYNEIRLYDFAHPGFSSATGHFTALVWKNSTNYGLGISIVGTKAMITMNLSPAGNYQNQYAENVLPPTTTAPTPTPTTPPPAMITLPPPSAPPIVVITPPQPLPPPIIPIIPTPPPVLALPYAPTLMYKKDVAIILNNILYQLQTNMSKPMIVAYIWNTINSLNYY